MLDYFLIFITVIVMLQLYLKKGFQQIIGWLILDIIIIISHLLRDTFRWQVIPLYSLIIFVVLYYVSKQIEIRRLKMFFSNLLLAFITLVMTLSILAIFAFPIPVLDSPEGHYEVGTLALNLERDYSDESRELRLQIWYPSDDTGQVVPWMMDGAKATEALANNFGLPGIFTGHLNEVNTSSCLEVPISKQEDRYPVIVMSHGWASFRNIHLNFAERLASEGYIVVGIDHTYAALMTRLSDGTIATIKKDHIREASVLDDGKELITVFSEDIDAVMEFLVRLDDDHKILSHAFDLDHIGLLGHSTGAGGQILYASTHDVAGVYALDPWVEPIEVKPLSMPIEVFRSEEWDGKSNDEHLKVLTSKVYQIDRTKHVDFTMFSTIAPFFNWINKTTGDYSTTFESYMLKFFDRNLKGIIRDPILDPLVHQVDV